MGGRINGGVAGQVFFDGCAVHFFHHLRVVIPVIIPLDEFSAIEAHLAAAVGVVDQLNRHILAMFDDPANRKRIEESFYDIVRLTADEYAARVRADVARWDRIVRETGIEVQ